MPDNNRYHYSCRTFVAALFSLLLLLVFGELFFRAAIHQTDAWKDPGTREAAWEKIYRKIHRGGSADVLFLGDSTVRNALVPDVFETVTGRTSMNLGMVGDFGTYGDFAALQAYLDHHAAPEAIVFWHTLDVWNRIPASELQDYTRCQLQPALDRELLKYRLSTATARNLIWWPVHQLESLYRMASFCLATYRYRSVAKNSMESILPFNPLSSLRAAPSTRSPAENLAIQEAAIQQIQPGISPANVYWLLKLRELAARNGIRLFLARSPLNQEAISQGATREHLQELNKSLDAYFALAPEIRILHTANPVFPSDLFAAGDKDHANERGAPIMTEFYARAFLECFSQEK